MTDQSFPFSVKIKDGRFCLLLNLLLALLIYLTAEIGRAFGIQQLALAVSVVWPPSGISLAAMLLFGFKMWPGILLGNLLNNAYHLLSGGTTILGPLTVAMAISLGSLLQAYLGTYIIRRFSATSYLRSLKDIIIFLIPGGVLACMIASSIGVSALYLYGGLSDNAFIFTWVTFWLGDSLGVYVFTPLILIWVLPRRYELECRQFFWEAVFMSLGIILVGYASIMWNYPVLHMFLPLSLWATYRFHMYGATLSILLICCIVIVPTSMGYGVINNLPYPLMVLVSFLEVIVFACLTLGAALEERESAWRVLQNHNIDLQETLVTRAEEIRQLHGKMVLKDRQASLGLFTLGVSKRMQPPLNSINTLTKDAISSLEELRRLIDSHGSTLNGEIQIGFVDNFQRLEERLKDIAKNQALARRIAQVVQEQSTRVSNGRIRVQSINLHTLIDMCLTKVLAEAGKRFSDFSCAVKIDYDATVQMLPALPEDLAYAFIHLFDHATHNMNKKRQQLGAEYEPTLFVQTRNHADRIEIILRDNGPGVSPDGIPNFFQSIIGDSPPEEATALGIALAHDIIVHVHQGGIKVESQEGEYLQITITLNKLVSEK
ncbi:MAG: MASE1 domain-containing protein [Chlamydiales bacterium]|nr:MASE1 domain-containing protein [Chlamydiales bacterium]